MQEESKKLGHNLKMIRTSKNITQSELADLIGVDKSFVSNIENGETGTVTKRFPMGKRGQFFPCVCLIISLRSSPAPQCSTKIIRFHHRFNPLLSAVGCSFVHCIANGLKSIFLFTGVDPSEILLWKRHWRFTQRLRIATCAQLCTSPPSLFTRSYQLCSNRIPFYVLK
jgi:DNA-binding XRE family transcriptional regulator